MLPRARVFPLFRQKKLTHTTSAHLPLDALFSIQWSLIFHGCDRSLRINPTCNGTPRKHIVWRTRVTSACNVSSRFLRHNNWRSIYWCTVTFASIRAATATRRSNSYHTYNNTNGYILVSSLRYINSFIIIITILFQMFSVVGEDCFNIIFFCRQ